MTMQVSKGLALPSVGHVPAAGEDEAEAARVFDVAATRAKQRLVMGGDAGFGKTLCEAPQPFIHENGILTRPVH